MRATAQRSLAAALCLVALPACGSGAPAARTRAVQAVVFDCYTTSAFQVSIDERPLALIPPARRDDSVARCYDGTAEVGPQFRVRVRSPGNDRQIALRLDAQSRFLHITPGRAPYAVLARDPPLLD